MWRLKPVLLIGEADTGTADDTTLSKIPFLFSLFVHKYIEHMHQTDPACCVINALIKINKRLQNKTIPN